MSANIKKATDERGGQYGDFRFQAEIAQKLKTAAREHAEKMGVKLEPYQAESIDMILHKISRIVNGNPNNLDSWLDIAGYATIVYERLPREAKEAVSAPQGIRKVGIRRRHATG